MRPNSERKRGGSSGRTAPSTVARDGFTKFDLYALVFGLFLGLAFLKFGNPIVLNRIVEPPQSLSDAWMYPWPPLWAVWVLIPLALAGAVLAMCRRRDWGGSRWLWLLPLVWFGWQLVSATRTVDGELTRLTILHLGGCAASYFLGATLLGYERGVRLLLAGLLAAFTFSLVRAVNQRLFEFPQEHRMLVEGERAGWTNLPPELVLQMKQTRVIVSTNGVDVANPAYLAKYERGRVHGTLVYPNALAGAILLLLPISMILAFQSTRRLRKPTRWAVITLTLFLGLGSLYWTGSKSGWLIAMAMAGLWLFSLRWPVRAKVLVILVLAGVSLIGFGVRFRGYFASGATSVGARFDYWRAAARITAEQPVFGSGPGTFQRPYAKIKAPEAEMARLAHNDYLEQFSDSGMVGGISYLGWVGLLLATVGKRVWRTRNAVHLGLFIGILGWFLQGFSEFSLYVPALSWTAFALGGCLLSLTAKPFDKAEGGC